MRIGSSAYRRAVVRGGGAAQGMTLIEVMVAAIILLVAMAGIVPLFMSGLTQASSLRLKSVATNIAREKMEMVRQLDYREVYTDAMKTADPALGTRTLESLFGTSETVRGASYTITYTVTQPSYQAGVLKQVTVNVGWTAPPQVSPASITTLIHQQFLGPRGSRLQVTPTSPDPRDSPFPLIANTTTAKYYVAQADWNLVYYDVSQPTPVARSVYMDLALFDDNGQSIDLGPAAANYKIDSSYLHYSQGGNGAINAVWFEYPFNASLLPDGYWELRAVVYNEYDEPGNFWRLRLRIEKGAPAAPASFLATAQADNQTVVLTWSGGAERDRDHYVLRRQKWNPGTSSWLSWVTLSSALGPNLSTYSDLGNVGSATDPWGSVGTQNYYQYALWAVDECDPGLTGPTVQALTYVPSATTTTTSSTTTSSTTTTSTSSTTTTTSVYWVKIVNSSNYTYALTVNDSGGTTVYTGSVKKNKSVTVSNLLKGNFMITATCSGRPTITQSFSLPAQAGTTVLTIM